MNFEKGVVLTCTYSVALMLKVPGIDTAKTSSVHLLLSHLSKDVDANKHREGLIVRRKVQILPGDTKSAKFSPVLPPGVWRHETKTMQSTLTVAGQEGLADVQGRQEGSRNTEICREVQQALVRESVRHGVHGRRARRGRRLRRPHGRRSSSTPRLIATQPLAPPTAATKTLVIPSVTIGPSNLGACSSSSPHPVLSKGPGDG